MLLVLISGVIVLWLALAVLASVFIGPILEDRGSRLAKPLAPSDDAETRR